MRLAAEQAETDIYLILKMMVLLFDKSSKRVRATEKGRFQKSLANKWFSMFSNALCDFVITCNCSVCAADHLSANAVLLFVAI